MTTSNTPTHFIEQYCNTAEYKRYNKTIASTTAVPLSCFNTIMEQTEKSAILHTIAVFKIAYKKAK